MPAGPPTRAGRIASLVLTTVFSVYLVAPVHDVFTDPHPAWVRVLVVADVLIYGGLYLAIFPRRKMISRRSRVVTVAVLFVCGLILPVVLGPDDLILMTYALAGALMMLPPLVGLLLGICVIIAILIGTSISDGAPNWNAISVLAVMTVALFGTRQIILQNAELRAARDEIATLAVAEERARMARDLHDVLGHSLTTITVKAGLARRLLESAGDGERAIAELRDVEHLSRTALAEVRSTVSGYRKASLLAELVGARAALQAAEITADLPHAVDNVPAELQEPFAYVLREGVTNVIRHSNARHCEVRLGESWIEIRDDGSTVECDGAGHGLAGLAERLEGVGGTLSAGPSPAGGFVVRASVPATVTA